MSVADHYVAAAHCGTLPVVCELKIEVQACVSDAVAASRTLKQTGGVDFPGCTFIDDSVLARNPDFSAFYLAAQQTGLVSYLQQLTAPATLFVPTNEALAESTRAANLTGEEALNSPLATGSLDYFVVTEAILVSANLLQLYCSFKVLKNLQLCPFVCRHATLRTNVDGIFQLCQVHSKSGEE